MIRVTLNATHSKMTGGLLWARRNGPRSKFTDGLRYVQLADETAGEDESFQDVGIEDWARRTISTQTPRHPFNWAVWA